MQWSGVVQQQDYIEIDPARLGTLELPGMWVAYVDLYDEPSVPTRIKIGENIYGFHSSMIISGHGAVLPQRVRALRDAGKQVLVIERGATGSGHSDRYFVYVSPP
jgi:hypothetical protein